MELTPAANCCEGMVEAFALIEGAIARREITVAHWELARSLLGCEHTCRGIQTRVGAKLPLSAPHVEFEQPRMHGAKLPAPVDDVGVATLTFQ